MPYVRSCDPYTTLGRVQRALEALLLLFQSREALIRLIAELAFGHADPPGFHLLDALGQAVSFVARDSFPGERPLHLYAQHLAGGAELLADHLGLANERVQDT